MGVVTAVAVLMGWWTATAGAQLVPYQVPTTPGQELQPLPGWACETPESPPGYAPSKRCSTTVAAGDAAVVCRQDRVNTYDSEDATECRLAVAGDDVVRCGLARTNEYTANRTFAAACANQAAFAGCTERTDNWGFGVTETTTGCGVAAGDAAAGCAHVTGEVLLGGETGDRDVGCGVQAGDTVARCQAARELQSEWYEEVDAVAAGCAAETSDGTTSCSARVDEVQTAPVLTPACPATTRPDGTG